MTQLSEKLIENCKNSDRRSQQKIFELMYSDMYKICLRYSNGCEEAKDFLQLGFIKLFNRIGQLKNYELFFFWARKLFINICLDELRKKKIVYMTGLKDAAEEFVDPVIEVEDLKTKERVAEKLIKAIQELYPAQKTCLNLYFLDGYTHKEVAEKLNISISTSKSNVHKAKLSIMKKMKTW